MTHNFSILCYWCDWSVKRPVMCYRKKCRLKNLAGSLLQLWLSKNKKNNGRKTGMPGWKSHTIFLLKKIIYSYLNFFHNILKAKGQWLEIFDTYLLLKTLPWWTGYFGLLEDISKGKFHNMYILIVTRLCGHKILAFFLLQIVKTFLKKKYYSVNFFVWISARNLKICLWCWFLFL